MAGGSFEDMEKEEGLYDYEDAPLNIKSGNDSNHENEITTEAAKEPKTSIKENISKEDVETENIRKQDVSGKQDTNSVNDTSGIKDEGEV